VKTGRLAALRFFGLEKLAGPYDAIDHAIARGVVRTNMRPQFAGALLDFYKKRGGREAAGVGRWAMPFYGEGKLPLTHLPPGQAQPSIKALLAYHASGGGIKPTTILSPGMHASGSKIVAPTEAFRMPEHGLSAFPSKDLPNMSELLKNPEPHMDMFKQLHHSKALDEEALQRWLARPQHGQAGLADIMKRLDLRPTIPTP
jgi:hypothetical protein